MSRMPKPSVRVVIPCFNHGRHVREAVESAFALEDAAVEVVVVDDGSDDGESPALCDATAALGATVLHRPNGGLSAARNTGAAGATTDYLAFLDADDLLLPHFARDLAAAIDADGGADVSHAYGWEQVTGLHELVWKCPPWDPIRELITNLHPVTALVRRDVFERVGGFDEALRDGHEDWELWIRCIAHGYRGVR
ncbi:MAG: glycosyltransferase family 2 protein, partial [Proteobacteria bacterium]